MFKMQTNKHNFKKNVTRDKKVYSEKNKAQAQVAE